ncbi:uncharacterized protein LOC144422272 [Styela clava]
MSDSEQQQIVPSLIDQQTIESIDQQTDKSNFTSPETIEADPAVQQLIESDIIDNNSSNDTDDSGNESPQQQQQYQQQHQHGPMIQDLGPEDEIHEEQGSGQEYQVEEPGEGPAVVQQPAQQQPVQQQHAQQRAVQHLPATQGGQSVVIQQHVHHHHHRNLYYQGAVYQNAVFQGDVVGSKSEIRDANIGAVGGSQQPPAIGGPGAQAALAWLGEGSSGSSQVPAIGGSEQRPALPWHEEGEREDLHSGRIPDSNQPLALPAPEAQISSPGNEQLEEIVATTPNNEPEILDSIKSKKKSKKWTNRRGSATASNSEISEAFPSEPSDRRDPNVASGARPKTTGPRISTSHQPQPSLSSISQSPVQTHPRNERRLPTNRTRSRSTDIHPGRIPVINQPLALPAPEEQISSPGNEQLEEIVATVPTGEPEVLDSIKQKKKSKRRSNRGGSYREPVYAPTPRSPVARSFVGEETLNPNVTTPKVVGSATPSNPQRSEAFPLIPPEPSNRRNANVATGARPKTTGPKRSASHQPQSPLRSISQPPVQTHQRNERTLPTDRTRSRSTDARYLSQLDETSEYEYSAESFNFTESNKESDSESTLSSVGSLVSHQRYRSYKKSTSTRKAGRKSRRSWMMQTENPVTESESQTSLVHRRDRMNQTDKKPTDDTEAQTDKRRTRDRHLQTDNYNLDMDTQTRPDIAVRVFGHALASTEMYVQTDPKQALDNNTQTTILQQTNTPTQTLVKTFQENEFQTDQRETIATFSQTNGISTEASAEHSKEYEESSLEMIEMYNREASTLNIPWSLRPLLTVIVIMWRNIFFKILSNIPNKSCGDTANTYLVLLSQFFKNGVEDKRLEQFVGDTRKLAKLAEHFENEGKTTHAVVAYYALAKLHKLVNKTPESAQGILSCIEQISLVIEEMIKQKQTKTLSHVMSLITEMTDFIGSISNYSQFIEKIISKATEFDSEEKFISSVVSFYVAAKLHGLDNKGDQSVIGIEQSVYQIPLVVENMTKQDSMKKIVIDHVIPLMYEIFEFVRMIKCSSHKVRVDMEAWCLFHIGNCYYYCDEYQEFANINETGIELIKRNLDEPQTYRIYGHCLNNAAVAYGRMGNMEKAIELYKMSLEAKMNAEDYSIDKAKNDDIKITRNNLIIAKSSLPK